MNILKKLISFILSIVLFILVLLFTLNLVVKRVVQKQIISGIVKNEAIIDYVDKNDDIHKKEIKKILEEPEAVELTNKLIDEYMEFVNDNNHKVSEKTVDGIIDFCVKHQKIINELSNEEVTVEIIKSQKTRNDLTRSINESLGDISEELGETPSQVIKVYSKLTSNNFQTALFISIIIVILLLMVVKSSLYKWMSKLGTSLIITGLLIGGLYAVTIVLIQKILEDGNLDITIKLDEMLVIAIVEVVLGIILIVLKKLNDKKENILMYEPSYNNPSLDETTSKEEAEEKML